MQLNFGIVLMPLLLQGIIRIRHWNTIILDGSIPENEIQRMISEL